MFITFFYSVIYKTNLLTYNTNYNETIKLALNFSSSIYDKTVLFHFFWNGHLMEKHIYSLKSCRFFHPRHRIILWLENNTPNKYNDIAKVYAEICSFSLKKEQDTIFENITYNKNLSYYSDVVRYVLLYKYGGCWVDLDVFFLRSLDVIFAEYGNKICVYQWETKNYPNGAIYICLDEKNPSMRDIIAYIKLRNKGWGFQEASITYDQPLALTVLPCSWFDPSWIVNPLKIKLTDFFRKTDKFYNFENFFPGAFCYHWHNQWSTSIEDHSIAKQLMDIIDLNDNHDMTDSQNHKQDF